MQEVCPMNRSAILVAVLVFVLIGAGQATADLISNGSFETPSAASTGIS
jgi:hypothetical protein